MIKLNPCEYCRNEMKREPILDFWQGRYSILCPYCLTHRGEWVDTPERAYEVWNEENEPKKQ